MWIRRMRRRQTCLEDGQQSRPQRCERLVPDCRVHVLERSGGGLGRCAAPVCEPDHLRASISRVVRSLQVAKSLEVGHEFRHRLLGDAGLVRKVGEPKAIVCDMRHHVVVRDAVITETGLYQVLLQRVGQMSLREHEEEKKRCFSVRVGHSTENSQPS